MKFLFVGILALISVNLGFSQITVVGEGKVKAEPDIATVNIGILADDVSSTVASEKMTTALNKVLDSIKQLKVGEKDICTTYFNLSQRYQYNDKESPKFIGFTASTQLHVKVRDLKQLGVVVDTAIKNGATAINNVKFDVSNHEKLLDDARVLAITEAKRKAKMYADNLNVNVGVMKSIVEYEVRDRGAYDNNSKSMDGKMNFQAGEKTFVINMTIVFEIDKKMVQHHHKKSVKKK